MFPCSYEVLANERVDEGLLPLPLLPFLHAFGERLFSNSEALLRNTEVFYHYTTGWFRVLNLRYENKI